MKYMNVRNLILFFILFLMFSCKKDNNSGDTNNCLSCKSTPEAVAANDASSKGVYKGVLIGSTGSVKFDVQNSGTLIKAFLTIDGVSAELTSTVSWVANQAYVGAFKGKLGTQDVSITFSVNKDGSSPGIVAANIPGHANIQFAVIKESSTALIECFEGKYKSTKPESGTFNLVLIRSLHIWAGIHREDGSSTKEDMKGTITADGKLMQDGTDYVGTLSKDVISGSFKDGSKTVTVNGKRTL